jgi:nitric oxide reductase activation protein
MPFQNKQVQTTQDAFKRISNAVHIDLQENYDGFAIYSLKDYFLKSTKRFMIVLSDGQPSGNGYRGGAANEHTKKIVDNLRKDGTNVYAISLVESVVQANNQIYGKQYNINGSGNLDSELRKLIVNLI